MAIETHEIPKLIFWIFLAGVAFVITAKITGEVSKQIIAISK